MGRDDRDHGARRAKPLLLLARRLDTGAGTSVAEDTQATRRQFLLNHIQHLDIRTGIAPVEQHDIRDGSSLARLPCLQLLQPVRVLAGDQDIALARALHHPVRRVDTLTHQVLAPPDIQVRLHQPAMDASV